jgi:tetratricopeptide (TPR) repeat protein
MPTMFRRTEVLLLLVPAMFGVASPAIGADTDWRDVESRMQYAWYTEDVRDLAAVAERVTAVPAADPWRSYYLAWIQLRQAQLAFAHLGSGDAAAAVGHAAAGCISSADDALAVRPTDAEVLALQSSCMDLRSRIRTVGVPFAASRSRAQMQTALQLAPKDPRVRLLAAQLSYLSAKSTRERTQLLAPFQSAVDAFELERQGLERIPAWGAAEAWQGLAQVYMDRGDPIAARSALEHALLLMPEYKSAHRLLDHILKG